MYENTYNLGTFVDLMTDFGFRKIFGQASNRKYLIDFLNALFDGELIVDDIEYDNPEFKGGNPE